MNQSVKEAGLLPNESAVARLEQQLANEGFVLLRELCPVRLVEQILDVAKSRIAEVRTALGSRAIGIGSTAGYKEIVQRSPGRWDLPIEPDCFGIRDRDMPWWPLVEALLGSDAEHSFSGVVFSEPGSPAQCWHIDSPHVAADHRPAHAFNVLVALHDIPLEMGPTEIARRSQRLTNHLANPALGHDELVYQHAETSPKRLVEGTGHSSPATWAEPLTAGSCLVFDDRILHRGLANRSERERYVGYFSYRKRGYIGDTHFEAAQSVFK